MKPSTDKEIVYVQFSGPKRGKEGERSAKHEEKLPPKSKSKQKVYEELLEIEVSDAPGRTMSATFTRVEVARLFDITEGRLKYWDKTDFISPSGYNGRRRCYTFLDLISIRSAKTLLENRISIQKTRRIITQLHEKLPRTSHPLSKLRIRGDARTVVVAEDEYEFEADSGQLLIDFSVSSIEADIVSQLPDHQAEMRQRTAYEWYLEGCRLDEDEDMIGMAEQAYHQAIHIDPSLANAYTNLGNLRYRLGAVEDARILYQKAVDVDSSQPEAHYNLGFLEFEDDHLQEAKDCFSTAVELDPTFADAHFNLAMTLFRLNEEKKARNHWKQYLKLEPSGPWADIARMRLNEI